MGLSNAEEEKSGNSSKTEKPWLFQPGVSGNPSGRPKDTLKAFMAREFRAMDDNEKRKWLKDNKVSPEVVWRMSEGNPTSELTGADGKPLFNDDQKNTGKGAVNKLFGRR